MAKKYTKICVSNTQNDFSLKHRTKPNFCWTRKKCPINGLKNLSEIRFHSVFSIKYEKNGPKITGD